MGIVNVTPDSFSGDGLGPDAAIARGLRIASEGAAIIDVGGESTRPGHQPVDPATEMARAIPVVRALAAAGLTVSIDTSKAEVAAAALGAGATFVNDVWGLGLAPEIGTLAAAAGAHLILTHNQSGTVYEGDLMAAIRLRLSTSIAMARASGVSPERIILDPGIGFGKTAEQSVEVLRRLDELLDLGYPILVGTSRKGFLGSLYGQPMETRVWGTAATVAAAILRGASIVRVHDVAEMVAVSRVAEGLRRG